MWGIAAVRMIETGVVIEPGCFTVMALMSTLGASPRRARDVNGFQVTVRVGQGKYGQPQPAAARKQALS
jgi:hypothetical protein